MNSKANPKDSNVYRNRIDPGSTTPLGSHIVTGYNFYKHAIPSGLLTGLKQLI